MAIEYKVIERSVIGGPDKGKKRFYASANSTGTTNLDALSREIERTSTVSGADIRAVLYALLEIIPDHLQAGNVVQLGEIGNFRITLSSSGEETAEAVGAKSVKGARITFAPGKKFKQVLNNLSYKKKS